MAGPVGSAWPGWVCLFVVPRTTHGFILSHFIDLLVKASASRAEDTGFDSCLRRGDFSGDLKAGTPVATGPGAWRHRVSWDWLARCE